LKRVTAGYDLLLQAPPPFAGDASGDMESDDYLMDAMAGPWTVSNATLFSNLLLATFDSAGPSFTFERKYLSP
jgi:hypothetical protein